jgi:hypothetical protein
MQFTEREYIAPMTHSGMKRQKKLNLPKFRYTLGIFSTARASVSRSWWV